MYLPLKDYKTLRRGDLLRQGSYLFTVASICGDRVTAVCVHDVADLEHWEVWEDEPRLLAPVLLIRETSA